LKTWLFAGTPEDPAVLERVTDAWSSQRMLSDNPTGADNQQETRTTNTLDARWVCGFVDGEGCFSVSIHRNANCRSTGGWQLHPSFHVYQHVAHRDVLDALVDFFGCGRVRAKGRTSSVWTYTIDSVRQIEAVVLPFFEDNCLFVKAADFRRFAIIVRAISRREHLERSGFECLVRNAYAMNAQGKQRKRTLDEILLGSSETARQAPGPVGEARQPGKDTVRPFWRQEEPGRNDLATPRHPAAAG
jgi:hypothetical protein